MNLTFNQRLLVQPIRHAGHAYGVWFRLYQYTNVFERSDGNMGRNAGPDPDCYMSEISWRPRDLEAFVTLSPQAKALELDHLYRYLDLKVKRHIEENLSE